MRSRRRTLLVTSIAAALAAGLLSAPAAHAAAGVTVAGPDGTATVAADSATEVTVRGSGFQSIPNGFGGVYVLFGWVDDAPGGSWKPSRGGVVGADYRYVPDSESADNAGFQKFLAFSGSSTESSAHGVLASDGSWSLPMVIPGAVFESRDRDGAVSAVDCREVTCGIITIGAHGVKNAANETFTPLRFGAVAAAAVAAPDAAGPAPAAAPGAVRLGVESATVDAGTAIVFTGQGFTPGEQVIASLDGGLSAVGPLTAGTSGEVAGALPVPADARAGTHLVTLRGAGSGSVVETEITVAGSGSLLAAAAAPDSAPAWVIVVLIASIALAITLVLTSVIVSIARANRRRQRRAAAALPGGVAAPTPPDPTATTAVAVPSGADARAAVVR